MFSFGLVYFASHAGLRLRLKIFGNSGTLEPPGRLGWSTRINYWRPGVEKTRTRCSLNRILMRTKFVVCLLVAVAFTSSAFAAVVVEKRSRQMPYVEVFGCEGVHAFVFRGPKGTSRRPILVPPREYWTAQEAGIYSFVLRYQDGNTHSRLVTPEVFAAAPVVTEGKIPSVIMVPSTPALMKMSPYFVRTSNNMISTVVPCSDWAYKQGKRRASNLSG